MKWFQEVEFASPYGKRPIRLCSDTRAYAMRALQGEFGSSLFNIDYNLDNCTGIDQMSKYEVNASSVMILAKNAPIRFQVNDDRLLGSACLKTSTKHRMPVLYNNEYILGESHTTCGFDKVISLGFSEIQEKIEKRLRDRSLDKEQLSFLNSLLICIDAIKIWHKRNIDYLKNLLDIQDYKLKNKLMSLYNAAINVPWNKPRNFYEALQSIWFTYSFFRLCGIWSGIGRIDAMLEPFLLNDLKNGTIPLEEARELIAHFWIKGCEWVSLKQDPERLSGDAQFYANIVLGGVDQNGNLISNTVTNLILDVVEELGISEFPIAIRISKNTDDCLLEKIAQVQRHGGGIVAVYNEDLVINSLIRFGYPVEEARLFANDGCWEVQVPGKTFFKYDPFDMLTILQNNVLGVNENLSDDLNQDKLKDWPTDFDSFYELFKKELVKKLHEFKISLAYTKIKWKNRCSPLLSILIDDCIERAKDYYNGGPRYNVISPHAGGLPDTANSLLAIKKLVYDDQLVTLDKLVSILKNNWKDHEELRRYACSIVEYFGNDNDQSNIIAKRIYDDYINICYRFSTCRGYLCPPGISTFGRQIKWRWIRGATADGHFKGEILSSNLSPTPGSTYNSVTAIIRSHCIFDLERLPCGTALDISLSPESIVGIDGIEALKSLVCGFLDLGGFFMQVDILDSNILKEAQKEPLKYKNLTVRVAGWSARFITLGREWQEMIINRTERGF